MVEKLSSESSVKLLIKLFIALSACLNVVQYGRHVSAEKYNIFSWLRVQNMRDFFLKTDWFGTMDHFTFKIING